MRTAVDEKLNRHRIRSGHYRSDDSDGLMGAFLIRGPKGATLKILSSGSDKEFGWEHVSVSLDHRVPRWDEMCFVKNLFWEPEEAVVQYHPPRAEYVNHHPHCLHLWRPIFSILPLPPSHLVGPKQKAST